MSRENLQTIKRVIVMLLVNTLALVIIGVFYSSVELRDIRSALGLAISIALLNALVWPILSSVLLRLTVYTLGLLNLLLNGIVIYFAAQFVEGVYIENVWIAILVAIGVTILNTIFSALLSIDDDFMYYEGAVKRLYKKKQKPVKKKPGVVFLEIDGLAEEIINKAIKRGDMPNLASWIKKGDHKLAAWETDLSAQTGASQAGILLGSNKDISAFRWVEKENGNTLVTSSSTTDAALIEKRHSNGQGLLANNGASRSNLFSGDAKDYVMTSSKMSELSKFYNPAYFSFFGVPYNFIRTFALTFWDVGLEIKSRIRQKRNDVKPRLGGEKRGGMYPFVRAFATVFLRDLTTFVLIGDIYSGEKDAIYATFVGYDEVAHHSGIEDLDAFYVLRKLDKQFGRIGKAAKEADRKYHVVVLSDHGQSKGATFKQRYGITLEDLVSKLAGDTIDTQSILDTNEGWSHLNTVLTDISKKDKSMSSKTVRKLFAKRIYGDSVLIGPDHDVIKATSKREKKSEIVVLASGNLGLIYFTGWKKRLTHEQLQKNFPRLVVGLAQHDGVGFVLVKSSKYGPVAVGKEGICYIKTGKVEGKNPLTKFGKNASRHLKRASGFKYAPDIIINSLYDPKKDEVAAFEELIGSHGGLGGTQSNPFLLYPSEWKLPKKEIVGAENLHKVLKGWVSSVN